MNHKPDLKFRILLDILALACGVITVFATREVLSFINYLNLGFPYSIEALFGLILFGFGLLFGFIWNYKGWKWGLWLAAPLLLLFILSVIGVMDPNTRYTPRIYQEFIEIVIINAVCFSAACLGALWGSRLKQKRMLKNNPRLI